MLSTKPSGHTTRGRYLYAGIICEKWETYDYDEIYS